MPPLFFMWEKQTYYRYLLEQYGPDVATAYWNLPPSVDESSLSPVEQEILTSLELGEATAAELARDLNVSNATLFRKLSRLEKAGLIKTRTINKNGRTKLYSLV